MSQQVIYRCDICYSEVQVKELLTIQVTHNGIGEDRRILAFDIVEGESKSSLMNQSLRKDCCYPCFNACIGIHFNTKARG